VTIKSAYGRHGRAIGWLERDAALEFLRAELSKRLFQESRKGIDETGLPRPNLFVLKKKKFVTYYQLKKQTAASRQAWSLPSWSFAAAIGISHGTPDDPGGSRR
jgi:hypothetical protein